MAWGFAQYVDYITRNAPPGFLNDLLQPASRQYSVKFPNISILYYSMPDWLDIFSFGPHNGARRPGAIRLAPLRTLVNAKPFEAVTHEYRFAAQKYQKKVADILNTVASFGTGTALLQEVNAVGRALRIMPHWHWERMLLSGGGALNAISMPTMPGQTFEHVGGGVPSNDADSHAKGVRAAGTVGTGRGANAALFYSPEDWKIPHKAGPGHGPDDIMFHELVHVTRQFRGLDTGVEVSGGGGFGNEEEYLATVLANLYLSEKGRDLRGAYSYDGPQSSRDITAGVKVQRTGPKTYAATYNVILKVLDPPPQNWSVMKNPDRWYDNPDQTSMTPRQLIQRFSVTQTVFYRALAHLPDGKPKFNPVKQFYRESGSG